jgi:putative FmdB family regulatory protein
MPTYDYSCTTCDNQTVTVSRALTEAEQRPICIGCGNRMARVFGLASVSFKGTGFYTTDK